MPGDAITIRQKNAKQLEVYWRKTVKKSTKDKRVLAAAALYYWRAIIFTFEAEGARDGHRKWRGFKGGNKPGGTKMTKSGTWNIRYGTDLRGSPTRVMPRRGPSGKFIPGAVRKGVRRYSEDSKLLQASGLTRLSFIARSPARGRVLVGSRKRGVEDIIKGRPVIFITRRDRGEWRRMVERWGIQILSKTGRVLT